MSRRNPAGPVVVRPDQADTKTFDWGRIDWIASGALGNSRQMTFGKVVIQPGRRNYAHRHPDSEEILHLLAGRLEHAVDEQVFTLQPGETIVIPAGARHHALALGEEDAVMLVFYPTPQRKIETD